MERLSRAGRKAAMKRVLMQHRKRGNIGSMTVGQIARRMGGKSSSNLKKMLIEMSKEEDEIVIDWTRDVFAVMFIPMTPTVLPQRFITINGKSCRVANWVLDDRESVVQNA